MSGGQRQRLAIARALLRDPRLLILDEATSALDAQTEAEIQAMLAEVSRGRTTVGITHHLASVTKVDRIYVLDRGRLVEEGPFGELVRAGGLFQRLYEEQMGHLGGAAAPVSLDAGRLRAVPLFSALDDGALATLAAALTPERYPADFDVVRVGDPGDKLYLVASGQVEVLVGAGERARRVTTLGADDYFGEMTLLTGEPRTATVRTTLPTELYSLSHAGFQALLAGAPAIRDAVARTVTTRRAALAALNPQAAVVGGRSR